MNMAGPPGLEEPGSLCTVGPVRHVGGHSQALLKTLNQQNQQAVAVLSGWEGNSSAGHRKGEFGSRFVFGAYGR